MERARRLRKGREFDELYEQGTVVTGPLLVLRYRANGLGYTRWGFAVGRRVARNAVDRNRVRRRLREAARTLGVAEGYDVIVTARAMAVGASYRELKGALGALLRRAGLLAEDGRG